MYLANVERKNRASMTLDFYLKKMRHLCAALGSCDVSALTLGDVESHMDVRRGTGAGLATIAKEIKALASALRYASKHGLYHGDPAAIIPDALHDVYTPRDRALTREEYRALHLALGSDRRDYLAMYALCGLRESELYKITPADVSNAAVHVAGTKTKRSDRWLPLNATTAEIVGRRSQVAQGGAPLFAPWHNGRRDLHTACRRAGIAPISFNDLRRSFASWLCQESCPRS